MKERLNKYIYKEHLILLFFNLNTFKEHLNKYIFKKIRRKLSIDRDSFSVFSYLQLS